MDNENLTDTLWAAAAQLARAKRLLAGMSEAQIARLRAASVLEEAARAVADCQLSLDSIKPDVNK